MYIYDLPSFENSKEDAEVYFTEAPAGATDHSLFISYSVDSSQLIDRIPFYPLPQNKAFLARIIIPAGAAGASIGAESPVIQSQKPETYPLLKGFSTDPGDFCNAAKIYVDGKEVCEGMTGDFLFPEDLHAPGGGINEQIYFGEPSPTERYGYFVVYQQDLAPREFTMVSFDISYIIRDIDLYRQWRTSKGLANNNVPKQTYDSYAQSYAQGVNEGIARCRANPSSCGISTGLTCPVTSTITPPATYDLASGQLYLPSVLIPAPTGTQNYEAYLLPRGNLMFEVDTSRLKQQ
jgi:hypothetical protein